MESAKNDEEECMMMKKLMKRALLLLIAAVMLFQMIPMAIAEEAMEDREEEEDKALVFWIVCRQAPFMQEPSTSSALLTTIPAGTQLKILGAGTGQTPAGPEDNRWSRVSYGGRTGYVRNWFLCRKSNCYRITRDSIVQVAGSSTTVVLKKGDYIWLTNENAPVGIPNARVMSGTQFGRSVYVGEKARVPVD